MAPRVLGLRGVAVAVERRGRVGRAAQGAGSGCRCLDPTPCPVALAVVTNPPPVAHPPGTRRSALRPLSQERQLRLEIERMKEEEAMRDKEGPVC